MSLTPPHWHRQVNLSVQGQPGLWIEFQSSGAARAIQENSVTKKLKPHILCP